MIGLIGTKIGMTQVFDDRGVLTPVTVIRVEENVVVAERTGERDGYEACILGSIEVKNHRVTKPYAGQFKAEIAPRQRLQEFRDFDLDYSVGVTFGVEMLEGYAFVDVIGTSKGKGYQGVMKRHGYHGGRASHGSKFHRELGSSGMAADPSKVHKGTKMPGRMGGVRRTTQNLRIVEVDKENGLLLVRGAIPGRTRGTVIVRPAKKKS